MRDHDADRLRRAKADAMDLGAKSIVRFGASIPASGRVQDVVLEHGRNVEVGDLVAKVEDIGEPMRPQFYRVTHIEQGIGGNPIRWLTLEGCAAPA